MISLTRRTWVWASSGSWWWTGNPGMLQSIELQSVRHNWVTELNWTESSFTCISTIIFICLVSVLFSVYLSMADKLHTLWMLQLIFITFCTLSLNSTFTILISRQEYWSGLLFPSPGDLSDPEIEPTSLTSPVLAERIFPTSATWEAQLELSLLCVLSRVQFFVTLCTAEHQLHCPWDFLGKNIGVGCHFLLQGIFPTQGSTKCDKNRSINYNIHNLWRRLSAINRCTLSNTETKHIKIILDTQVKLDFKYLYRID